MEQRTRHSQRSKKFAPLVKSIDNKAKEMRDNLYIDQLESDYYDEPNKLAEDEQSDDFDADEEDPKKKKSKKVRRKKVPKKVKISAQIRKNLNLRKMLKDENQEIGTFANFVGISVGPPKLRARRFCSMCGVLASYTCPRCHLNYCCAECNQHHKEIQCLRPDF